MQTLNPAALLHPDTEIKISAGVTTQGRGMSFIRVSFGASRWAGTLIAGDVTDATQSPAVAVAGDLEHDLPAWLEDNPYA
ncbi:MAG TPA: hypothetical protein VGR71_12330 [Nitrospira sp.]|nr:hypothetical protein [Nitrospira sp.]